MTERRDALRSDLLSDPIRPYSNKGDFMANDSTHLVAYELPVHPGMFHGFKQALAAPLTVRAPALRHDALKRLLPG